MRRTAFGLGLVAILALAFPRPVRAFGDIGGFDPRALSAGGTTGAARPSAPSRWAWELVQRTSAPARIKPAQVRADEPSVTDDPFLWWSGSDAVEPLSSQEIAGLRKFFALGGVLFVDDAAARESGTEPSAFAQSARAEIARVLPDGVPITLRDDHVLYKTFYLLKRAEGRVLGPPALDAIVRSGRTQVIFSAHDLGGALARTPSGQWELAVVPGGERQRERAVRLAVNIAMYVLCSNYKDDQVHAPFLMRRRASPVLP